MQNRHVQYWLLLTASLIAGSASASTVKNVILVIGDGMGPQQIGLLESYARLAPQSIYQGRETYLQQFAKQGRTALSLTHPSGGLVADSACSATQLAIGQPAPSEALGVDAKGYQQETVLEKAKRFGKATGLVSDTRLTHATPAAFAAHQPHRSLENRIAVEMLAIAPDVMFSGGLRHWLPKSINEEGADYTTLQKRTHGNVKIKSKRWDNKNLLTTAEENGYQVALNRGELNAIKSGKALGLFAYAGMNDGIRNTHADKHDETEQPTLAEMTKKALTLLEKDKDGFFLMVEAGQIDWAAHNSDTGTLLHEMIKLDQTLAVLYQWVKERDDTVVIITADHETGGFGFSYSIANLPAEKKLPGDRFRERSYKPNYNFGRHETLDKIYQQKRSFVDQAKQFNALEKKQRTPANLVTVMNKNNAFTINEQQASRILANERNPYFDKSHPSTSIKKVPKIASFPAFYPYGSNSRYNLMGQAFADQQHVTWSTGTHTGTPVSVIGYGSESALKPIAGILDHAQLGQLLHQLVTP